MLNTRFLTYPNPIDLPGWDVVFEGDHGVVLENSNPLPKAWFVDDLLVAESAHEAMDQLVQLNTADAAILQDVDDVPQIQQTDNREAVVTEYGPREIRLDLQTTTPSFLVLSEVYYPAGWHAALNGEEIAIHRTNYVLRGFEIPAGEHELTLRFDPQSHILGGRLSWVFNILILLIGVAAFGFRYREK